MNRHDSETMVLQSVLDDRILDDSICGRPHRMRSCATAPQYLADAPTSVELY